MCKVKVGRTGFQTANWREAPISLNAWKPLRLSFLGKRRITTIFTIGHMLKGLVGLAGLKMEKALELQGMHIA